MHEQSHSKPWDGWDGIERRKDHCTEHYNCVYRIAALEDKMKMFESKLGKIIWLLVGNLASAVLILISALIATFAWIAKNPPV